MRILIVDDHKDIILILTRYLKKWGYDVIVASNGIDAWDILQKEDVNFVISDWMMPQMTGLELCRKIRNSNSSKYIYIILLTAKDKKEDLVLAMETGADDFIVKPFDKEELHVRIKSGERVLKLERDLEDRNRKLENVYSIIKKDLEMASKVQRSLLPPKNITIKNIKFDWLFYPSHFLAGDIFNFFELNESYIGFYLLDVAGHGIPSSMFSVMLSKSISPSINSNILRKYDSEQSLYEATSPGEVLRELNVLYESNQDSMQYFTIIYGTINMETYELTLAQGGHPHPIYIRKKASPSLIGKGGFPVGMFSSIDYEEEHLSLSKGDRIFLYSDGITECEKDDDFFSQKRLLEILEERKNTSLEESIREVEKSLLEWRGNNKFNDDLSLLGIEIL